MYHHQGFVITFPEWFKILSQFTRKKSNPKYFQSPPSLTPWDVNYFRNGLEIWAKVHPSIESIYPPREEIEKQIIDEVRKSTNEDLAVIDDLLEEMHELAKKGKHPLHLRVRRVYDKIHDWDRDSQEWIPHHPRRPWIVYDDNFSLIEEWKDEKHLEISTLAEFLILTLQNCREPDLEYSLTRETLRDVIKNDLLFYKQAAELDLPVDTRPIKFHPVVKYLFDPEKVKKRQYKIKQSTE